MAPDLWLYENQVREDGYFRIAGLDEAGRGPLAGPVVAAAVVLPPSFSVTGVNDSKKLTEKKRDELFDKIYSLNILRASLLAMDRAVADLSVVPEFLLIDGTFQIEAAFPQTAIPKGDSKSISIAAASIIAKVTRDRLMLQYHKTFPQYDFDRHKGYPTRAHRDAIKTFGCCPIHRKSFKGVKEYL
jgi:ribonuclease HII